MFEYAIQTSFLEMEDVIAKAKNNLNSDILKKEVNYRVGTFIHWVLDYFERIEKSEHIVLDEQTKSFFSGLRYANNKLKHDIEFIKCYERTGGFSFPITFPLIIESVEFKFVDFPRDNLYRNQNNNYQKHFANKEILLLAKEVLKRLENLGGKYNEK